MTERKIKEQETRITRKKRNEIWSKARQSGRARLERLLSQSWPRFSLVFPCHHPGYISVIFRESHSIISLSSVFYRLATDAPLPPPRVSRPVSFRSGPAKAGQYVILAVSLFLRTKAGSKLEKPRHARNGRNPAAFPPPFERNLG